MKLLIFFLILMLFLTSCGPTAIAPLSTPTLEAQSTATETIQVPQPDLRDGWITFSPAPLSQSPIIVDNVVYDPQGYLWVISSEGVLRWNTKTHEFTRFAFPDRSTADTTSDMILFDGIIWLALRDGRVGYFLNGEWNCQHISSKPLFSFSDTGDRLWLSGEEGLFYLEGVNWKTFKLPAQAKAGLIIERVAKAKDGTLWFKSTIAFKTNEVYSMHGEKWQAYSDLNPPNTNIIAEPNGLTWLISYTQAVAFDGISWSVLELPNNDSEYNVRTSGLSFEGNLWLETDKGVFIVKDKIPIRVRFPPYLIADRWTKVRYVWNDGVIVQIDNAIYIHTNKN